jgi:isocitrate dehydrogenase
MHQAGIDFLKQNGSPDPKTLGSVTTVRLQAEGAEEYGSKDTTFEAQANGTIELILEDGKVLNVQNVNAGDLWRLCRTTEAALQNWIELAFQQTQKSNDPVIFWLDKNRAHDQQIIGKVQKHMANCAHPPDVKILSPEKAMVHTLERSYAGQNTICVTGNLLGDHITDYFPILEIGSSSKMLSVIKLLNGGLVAETGSGGTAPDLLGMMAEKNHFLWDDTGTAFAMCEALRHLNERCKNTRAIVMADTLQVATERYIKDNRSPSFDGLDARESHVYLARYWAQELARQEHDPELSKKFEKLAENLEKSSGDIALEMKASRKQPADIGGRYYPDREAVERIMRPSPTLNALIPV